MIPKLAQHLRKINEILKNNRDLDLVKLRMEIVKLNKSFNPSDDEIVELDKKCKKLLEGKL